MSVSKISGNNLKAYEGVEDLKTFASKDAVEKYRQERISFASKAVFFLDKHVENKKPVSVLDIGSGSSGFLYALFEAGILSHGMGIEIAKTRHAFAEKWKQDKQYLSINNVNKDIRKISFKGKKFDVCTVLDSTFTYFSPIDADMPQEVLRIARNALNKGGCLILEILISAQRDCKKFGNYYEWRQLPESDKFRYALHKVSHLLEKDVYCVESRYLYRDKLEEVNKTDYSKMYTAPELKKMVLDAGFKKPMIYGDYDSSAHDPEKSKRILLICRV